MVSMHCCRPDSAFNVVVRGNRCATLATQIIKYFAAVQLLVAKMSVATFFVHSIFFVCLLYTNKSYSLHIFSLLSNFIKFLNITGYSNRSINIWSVYTWLSYLNNKGPAHAFMPGPAIFSITLANRHAQYVNLPTSNHMPDHHNILM